MSSRFVLVSSIVCSQISCGRNWAKELKRTSSVVVDRVRVNGVLGGSRGDADRDSSELSEGLHGEEAEEKRRW
jgi:hypothetical protein